LSKAARVAHLEVGDGGSREFGARPIAEKGTAIGGQVLAELSNAMVALHREYFGRGPGAARSFASDGMVVCVLTDIYTQVEKTLIRAGQFDHVRDTRALHQEALEADYKRRVEEVTGRPVEAFLRVVHVDPDVSVEVFLLSDSED
jgi:uncharacterized protein YbcI